MIFTVGFRPIGEGSPTRDRSMIRLKKSFLDMHARQSGAVSANHKFPTTDTPFAKKAKNLEKDRLVKEQ